MLTALGGEAPDILLHVGDLAYNFCTEAELSDHLMKVYEQTLRHTPLWPAIGHHEWFNNNVGAQTGPYTDRSFGDRRVTWRPCRCAHSQ